MTAPSTVALFELSSRFFSAAVDLYAVFFALGSYFLILISSARLALRLALKLVRHSFWWGRKSERLKKILQIVHASASLFQMLYDLTPPILLPLVQFIPQKDPWLCCVWISLVFVLMSLWWRILLIRFQSQASCLVVLAFFRHNEFVLVTHKTFLKLN